MCHQFIWHHIIKGPAPLNLPRSKELHLVEDMLCGSGVLPVLPLSPLPAPVDYTPIDSMLTIASGTTQECIPVVATTDDDIVEDDESFDISLSTANPDVNVTSASTTVTITEDADSVNVAFQEPSYTIPEGTNGSVCVTVVTGVLERDIMVTVSSVDDTAVGKPECGVGLAVKKMKV